MTRYELQSCLNCGKMHARGREFCSDDCRKKHWRASRRLQGGGVDAEPDSLGRCANEECDRVMPSGLRPGARYCSAACRQAAYRQRQAAKAKE